MTCRVHSYLRCAEHSEQLTGPSNALATLRSLRSGRYTHRPSDFRFHWKTKRNLGFETEFQISTSILKTVKIQHGSIISVLTTLGSYENAMKIHQSM